MFLLYKIVFYHYSWTSTSLLPSIFPLNKLLKFELIRTFYRKSYLSEWNAMLGNTTHSSISKSNIVTSCPWPWPPINTKFPFSNATIQCLESTKSELYAVEASNLSNFLPHSRHSIMKYSPSWIIFVKVFDWTHGWPSSTNSCKDWLKYVTKNRTDILFDTAKTIAPRAKLHIK